MELSSLKSTQSSNVLSSGLKWALASKGILIKDKAFHNLEPSELQKKGAKTVDALSGLPMFVRGNAVTGLSEISSSQFSKLLKQVVSHISLEPRVFIQDGAIGTNSKCDAKVRIISDNPTAALTLSSFLWKVSVRAISHDPCPMTVYVAGSISPSVGRVTGIISSPNAGFLAADIERSSLILCGNSFANTSSVKDVLSALAAPVISARNGLPIYARIAAVGSSAALLFTVGDTVPYCCKHTFLSEAGVVLFSGGASPLFCFENHPAMSIWKPSSVILTVSDSSGVIPSISKLSSGQAAYHFLAGYHDGKFVPTYFRGPSPIPSLELARALNCYLEENCIPSFLVNINIGGKFMEGDHFTKLLRTTLSECTSVGSLSLDTQNSKVRDLKWKYKSFLLGKFGVLPGEFLF